MRHLPDPTTHDVPRKHLSAGTGSLILTGRDIEEQMISLNFADGRKWQRSDAPCEPEISSERQAILDCLTAAPGPMTPKAIADATGKGPDAIRQLLGKMLSVGQVAKTAESEYHIPLTTDHTGHSDHSTHDSHADRDNTPEE